MVGVRVSIDDVANLAAGKLADGGESFVRNSGESGIDQQNPLLAGLHRDVATRANDHVDVALNGLFVNFVRRTFLRP